MMFTLRCLPLALLAVALCSAGGCVAGNIPGADEEVVVMTVTCGSDGSVKVKESGDTSEKDCPSSTAPYSSAFCDAVKKKCPQDTAGKITSTPFNVTATKKGNNYKLREEAPLPPAPPQEKEVEKGPQGDNHEQLPPEKQPNGKEVQKPKVDQDGVDSTDPKSPEDNAGGSANVAGAPNPEEKKTASSTTADKPTPPLPPTNKDTRSESESLDGSDITAWARVPLLLLPAAFAYIVAC